MGAYITVAHVALLGNLCSFGNNLRVIAVIDYELNCEARLCRQTRISQITPNDMRLRIGERTVTRKIYYKNNKHYAN